MEKQNSIILPIIRPDFIERCLETLYKYTEDNFYVYVVDQTPHGVYDKIKDKVHMYLRPWRNCGFAKACNTGIRLADTPYITLMNDDVECINSAWWQGIIDTFEKHGDRILAVNPMSCKEAGWGYGWPADKYVEILPYKETYTQEDYDFLMEGDFSSVRDRLPATCSYQRKGTVVDGIAMWCPIFKRETFQKFGLLHERFYPGGGEDYDYNAKVYSHGYRFLSTASSWVYHHWSSSKGAGMGENNTEEVQMQIDPKRAWNCLGENWPPALNEGHDLDIWGFYVNTKREKVPYQRASVSDIVPL